MKKMIVIIRVWDKELKKFKYPDLFSRNMPTNWKDFYDIQLCINKKDKRNKNIFFEDIILIPSGFCGDYYYDKVLGIVRGDIGDVYVEKIDNNDFVEQDFNWEDTIVVGNIKENINDIEKIKEKYK